MHIEAGRQAEASKQWQAGREAGMGGRQAYRHTKAGWQRRRQKCMLAKTSKEAEPGRQEETVRINLAGKGKQGRRNRQVKAARTDRQGKASRYAEPSNNVVRRQGKAGLDAGR
jgi:hypothetical protein